MRNLFVLFVPICCSKNVYDPCLWSSVSNWPNWLHNNNRLFLSLVILKLLRSFHRATRGNPCTAVCDSHISSRKSCNFLNIHFSWITNMTKFILDVQPNLFTNYIHLGRTVQFWHLWSTELKQVTYCMKSILNVLQYIKSLLRKRISHKQFGTVGTGLLL